MMRTNRTQLEAALARLLDGEPEPGDGEMLAAAMRADPGLRREVSGLLAVDDLLRQNADLSADDFAGAVAERLTAAADDGFIRRVHDILPGARPWWRRVGRLATAAAVVIVAGIVVTTLALARGTGPEVATLLLAEKCQWRDPGAVQEGKRLAAGSLRLRDGLAVLRFDGGAELMLRGDTEIELQSAVQARLVRGEVTVRAPEEAAGFKLLTPAGEVVDLGTEFAARVERVGATELHVLEGEVAFNARGQAGEVLSAGQAVRFDAASAGASREVEMHADRFAEIIRAARPAPRSELMLAYEGFSYPPGHLPLAELNGGLGWRGPWRAATPTEAYRAPEEPVRDFNIVDDRPNVPWPVPGGGEPGMLELPVGTTSRARTLAHPIAMDTDGVLYFSMMVREPDAAPGSAEQRIGGVRLVFRSSASPMEDMLSFGPSRVRTPGIRLGNGVTFMSPLKVARNQSTLWIGKIVTRRSGDDEMFFSVYGEKDVLGFAEPATWQVATRGVRRSGRLDVVVIAGQLSAPCAVDELRIGPTWRSVAPMQELREDPR